MSIWKDIVEVTEKAFQRYPKSKKRALKYIDRKLKAMKISSDIRKEILDKYHR